MDLDDEELKATRKMKGLIKMTADEMFEELGYKKIHESNCATEYELKDQIGSVKLHNSIIIANLSKLIFAKDLTDNQFQGITFKELQAINKKVEELGWRNKTI